MKPKILLLFLTLIAATVSIHPVMASSGAVQLEMLRMQSGNIYVHGLVGEDTETDLLLDTGAGYVSLSKKTFDRLQGSQKPRFSRYIYGALANGKVEKISLFILDSLKLSENCIFQDIEVALLPHADKDILGLNALTRMGDLTVQFSSSQLTSAGCES